MEKNLYDIFVYYIMPNFIDLAKYPNAEETFYNVWLWTSIVLVLTVFIYPFWKGILYLYNGGKKRRFLK